MKDRIREIGNLIFHYKDIATIEERAELLKYLKFEVKILEDSLFLGDFKDEVKNVI